MPDVDVVADVVVHVVVGEGGAADRDVGRERILLAVAFDIAKDWKDHKAEMAQKERLEQRRREYNEREHERNAPMREIIRRAGPIPKKKN